MTRPPFITQSSLTQFIKSALAEDVGVGDHSTLATIQKDQTGKGILKSKQEGIVAGVELAESIFKFIDPTIAIEYLIRDGGKVKPGISVLEISGSVRSILTGERLGLNCIQRMSGIATHTKELCNLIGHTQAKVMDTRKTTPNFRMAEKWAVWIGGGINHRMGLFDLIMLKDNHIEACGGVKEAIRRAKEYLRDSNQQIKIEIEARTLEEIETILSVGGIDVIMLDNMSPKMMKESISLINGKFKTEASGGITADTIVSVAETGVDFISVGALTHSVKSLDFNLKLI